jgi:hypothetical protein
MGLELMGAIVLGWTMAGIITVSILNAVKQYIINKS